MLTPEQIVDVLLDTWADSTDPAVDVSRQAIVDYVNAHSPCAMNRARVEWVAAYLEQVRAEERERCACACEALAAQYQERADNSETIGYSCGYFALRHDAKRITEATAAIRALQKLEECCDWPRRARVAETEIARLRAWLKHIEVNYLTSGAIAHDALVGEPAPEE